MLAALYVIHISGNTQPFITFTNEDEAIDFVQCLREDDGIPAYISEIIVQYDDGGVVDVDIF